MDLVENSYWNLHVNGKPAINAITEVEKKIQDLTEKQSEFTRGSKDYAALGKEIRETKKELELVRKEYGLAGMTVKQLEDYQRQLNREIKKTTVGSDEYVKQTSEYKLVQKRLDGVRKDMGRVRSTADESQDTWSKLKGWIIGAFAVQAVIAFGKRIIGAGKAIFDITAKFETYNTVIRKMLGSNELATAALDMIKSVAVTTNWSVDELTDSFIKLNGRGLKPSSKDIVAISDVANFLKKDFGQLVEAINDVNNTERWTEIGIKAKTNGDKVSLTFRGVTETVDKTEAGVLSAITAFGQMDEVMGITAEMSATLQGKVSNLGDAWDFVQVTLGEKLKPIFLAVLDLFVRGVQFVSDFVNNIEPLVIVFNVLRESNQRLWSMMSDLFFTLFPKASGLSFDMSKAIKILATVFMALQTPILIVRGVVIALIDAFGVLIAAAKTIGAAVTGDFAEAAKGAAGFGKSVTTLKNNAVGNFGAIKKGYDDIWASESVNIKTSASAWDNWVATQKGNAETVTTTNQKEVDKRLKAEEKAIATQLKAEEKALATQLKVTAETIKKIDAAWIESEENELLRNKKNLMAKFEDELSALESKQVSAEKYAELEKQLKENLVRDLEEIGEKAAEKERKDFDKKMDLVEKEFEKVIKYVQKKHEKEDELTGKTLKRVEEMQKKRPELTEEAALKIIDLEKKMGEQIIVFIKKTADERKKDFADELARKKLQADALKLMGQVAGMVLNKIEANVQEQLANATNATQRVVAENKLAWISVADGAMAALDQFANGNIVGGIVGTLGTLFGALDNLITGRADKMQARLEDLNRYLREAGDTFIAFSNTKADLFDTAAIEAAYAGLVAISELPPPTRFDLAAGVGYEQRIKEEMDLAKHANASYDTRKKREEEYNKQVIDNINAAFNAEVGRINEKYDLLGSLANQQFTDESIAIRELQGQRLLELVTNEEEKTAVLAEYAAKRNEILTAFSLADQAITDETDKVTLDAINAAREARTTALAELQGKLNKELEYIINAEDGKRKQLTATEQIAKDAEEALDTLRLEKQAADILREKEKNTELVNAEKVKNDLLQAEAGRFNDELVRLGTERDAALAESFDYLKQLMKDGYDEIITKAKEAMEAGKITTSEYDAIIGRWNALKNLIGEVKAEGTPTLPNFDFDWNFNVPKFAAGTEYVDAAGRFPAGTDRVPAMLNKGERVIDTGKNMLLGGMSNSELLQRAVSTMSANSYAKNSGMIDTIVQSSIYRTGKVVFDSAGFGSAQPPIGGGGFGSAQPPADQVAGLLRELNGKMDDNNMTQSEQLAAMWQYVQLLGDVKNATNRAADAQNMQRNNL